MAEPGAEISLKIHTHVREDALALYGFATLIELQLFERLTAIPGVGKKTAERIGLELKDKLSAFVAAEQPAVATAPTADTMRSDVLSALVNLGYHRPLAERAADAALQSASGSFEQVLKQALREL